MIELIAAAVSGAVVGALAMWMGWRVEERLDRELIKRQRELIECHIGNLTRILSTLSALRSNCFIHNEKGHFTPYSQASAQRRVKAETPKEVV